jgi:chromosome segregation ATPase
MTLNLDWKKLSWPLYIAAWVTILFLAVKVYKISDSYSLLKGSYTAHAETVMANEKAAEIQIAGLQKEITLRDTAIVKANAKINALTLAGATASGHLSDLQSEYYKIMEMGGDKDSQITNLNAQIDAWAERFAIAEQTIKGKDEIIFSLTAKYSAQVSISASWESQFKAERTLRFDAEKLIRSLEWKVRAVRAKNTITTLAALAVGGIVLYDKLKGK